MQSATGAETTSMSTRVEDVPTATAAAAGPRCYRDEVRSTVELAALVYRPLAASGVVLNILRGGLFHQRGVRNVMDVTAVSTLDSTHDGDAAAVRVDYVAVDGSSTTTTVGADAPTATAPAHLHGRCKLCLLDPARVPAVEGLRGCGPVFRVGAGVDGASVVQCAEAAVAAGRLPRAAADLLLLLQDRLSSGAVAEAGAATTAHGRKRSSAAAAVGVVEVSFTTRLVELSYRNYTMPELLAMVLPVEEETALVALSGFEQVGHIAHVNLSAAHLPHADVIGQVILDCNDTVRIVVNKVDAISSVFREFKMDIIAERRSPDDVDESAPPPRAESLTAAERLAVAQDAANSTPAEAQLNCRLTATVRQHGCSFRVPYNRVYWNSRLSFEHTRLVESMSPGDLLFDVMAGVGPFAVPAARSGVFVLANDLNPVAAQYMRVNAELNNVPANMLTVYNMDGRDFLNTVLLESITGTTTTSTTTTAAASPSPLPPPHLRRCTGRRHVVMNLPAIAVTFLDVFKPCNATASSSSSRSDGGRCCWTHLPADVDKDAVDRRALFHVYCFSAAADLAADAVRQVEENLGYALPSESVEGTLMVRDVAPTKRMMCVSFTLPPAFWERLLASPSPCGDRSATESPLKRMRAD